MIPIIKPTNPPIDIPQQIDASVLISERNTVGLTSLLQACMIYNYEQFMFSHLRPKGLRCSSSHSVREFS